jgi:hypothetical protein
MKALGFAFLAFALQAGAQVMTSLNSTVAVNPLTQAGMYSWNVDGVNNLYQEWFWYALGSAGASTAPSSIDSLALLGDSQAAGPNQLLLTYGGAGFTLSVNYTLTGGTAGSGTSDIGESIRIINTSGSYLPLQFYEYADFDLQNQPGGQTVQLSGPGGGFNTAFQTLGNLALNESVAAPNASFAEANVEGGPGSTLAKLNNGVAPVVLDNNLVSAGAVTWAFQWNLDIAPGGTALISKDKYLETTPIPEPSVLALLPMGSLVCFAAARRRRRASSL